MVFLKDQVKHKPILFRIKIYEVMNKTVNVLDSYISVKVNNIAGVELKFCSGKLRCTCFKIKNTHTITCPLTSDLLKI